MIRAVLDTSDWVKGITYPTGASGAVVDAWRRGLYEVVCTESILEELGEVLRRRHIQKLYSGPTEVEIEVYVGAICAGPVMMPGGLILDVVKDDPEDNHVLACAVEGGAGYLISADKHLLSLGEYQEIKIMTAVEFLEVLRSCHPGIRL
jgi:uncharacterized protein